MKSNITRFGAFELDRTAGELRKLGRPLKLEPQPFQVLDVLVRNAGSLVTREELRSELWPEDTFVEFDHSFNTAIKKIRQALGDSAQAPQFVETVPRRGYRFIAAVGQLDDGEGDSRVESTRGRWWLLAAAGMVFAAVGLIAGWGGSGVVEDPPSGSFLSTRLTSYPGREYAPSFSPDGDQVAFTWCREDDCGVYIKQLGVEQPSRFADGPANEFSPAWSPDGKYLAFIRVDPDTADWHLILKPQRGGWERALLESPEPTSSPYFARYVTWFPDGKTLAAAAAEEKGGRIRLFSVGVDSKEVIPLTDPPSGGRDVQPSIAPDGKGLLFTRWGRGIFALNLAKDASAKTPIKVANNSKSTEGAVYLTDGREILIGAGYGGVLRKQPRHDAPAERLPAQGHLPCTPTVSADGKRAAYAAAYSNRNIWRLQLSDAEPEPESLIASTTFDLNPAFSADGQRIAFMSDRSGSPEIWVAQSDGSNPYPITAFGGPWTAEPSWSHDGEQVAFYSLANGTWDVYVTAADGTGDPRLITSDPDRESGPTWSPDGDWIYFTSPRSGKAERWRIRSNGEGEAIPMPRADSPDGQFIYYPDPARGVVWREPVDGGEPTPVVEDLHPDGVIRVFRDGFYYIGTPGPDLTSPIRFFDFAADRAKTLAQTPGPAGFWSLAVSPDRNTILWVQDDGSGSDLMLVENFQ